MSGYSIITDTLTVSPPLNASERAHLRRLSNAAPVRTPGYHSPWAPCDDGTTLEVFEEFGTKQPVAEWAAYLATHLLGPTGPDRHGRALKGFTYDHTLLGDVEVQGRAGGDVWTLRCREDGITVHRDSMPCASCWAGALLDMRPTCAYRFIHPVREANLIDGHDVNFDHDGMEAECLSRTWAPVGPTTREVTWPMPRDYYEGWWIDLALTPDAKPFTWRLDDDPSGGDVIDFPATG